MTNAMKLDMGRVFVEMVCVRCKRGKNTIVDIQKLHKDGGDTCAVCNSPMYIHSIWYQDDANAKRKMKHDSCINPVIKYEIQCPECGFKEIPLHVKSRKEANAWAVFMASGCPNKEPK